MGSRLHGNDGPAAAHPTIVIPATAGIHGSHIGDGGNPRGGGDGFPSPRERRAGGGRTPQSSFPQRRESTAGDGFPSPRERRAGGGAPHGPHRHSGESSFPQQRESTAATSSFPRRRESTAGGRRWVPVSTGTTGRRRAHPTIVIPATAGIHGRGAGDGFPSPRERRAGGGRTPQSSFPRRRESTAGGRRWVPVSTGTTGRRRRTPQSNDGRRRAHPHRHSRDGGNPSTAGGPAMGSRLHGNDGPAAAHPTIVIPATAGIHGGGPAMGSRLHGNDGPAGAPHNRHSRDGGNPRGGAGDGFPSPRERRAGGGRTPQSSFPRRRGSRDPGARPPPPSFTVGSLASRVESTRHSGPRAGIQGWGGQARWRAAAADAWLTSGRLQRLAPPTCPCRLFHRDPAVTSMRPCTAGLW